MISPTVGRVVLFWPSRGAGEPQVQQPYAATVAYVHSDIMVNLSVVDHNGKQFGATSVPLVQDDAPAPVGYYCEWMPYQKGQAAKTEALEAAVKA